jgi:hypothetical protein
MASEEKGKTWEVVKFALPIAMYLLIGAYFYGEQSNKMETLGINNIELKAEVRTLSVQVNANTSDVSVLKNDIEYIKENGEKTYNMLSDLVDRLRN